MTEKRNIHALIEKEAPSLNNLLDPEDVKEFKAMTAELRDTWTKKQVFRTETEMRMSVLFQHPYVIFPYRLGFHVSAQATFKVATHCLMRTN